MIENPIARNAFFPEGAADYIVEPATANDADDIREILETKEPEESARLFMRWWDRHPETFSVARSPEGRVDAFYFTFEPEKVDHSLLEEDPLTSSWLRHIKANPLAPGERVLFLPRWLDRETGEAPSPAVGASFLDIKRTYMELRPGLRRIYSTATDLLTLKPILFPLGFAPIEEENITIGGTTYHLLVNDFGPSSIDGWLADLIGTELRLESTKVEETPPPVGTLGEDNRLLLTVLFTDIVGSTKKAVDIGDSRWRDLLEHHHTVVRRELARFQGREIDTAGDGFLATFDKPANAIQCACTINEAIRDLGIEIRAGVHLGECEVLDKAVRGIAVHIGARVASKAESGEILVSRTIKDAVAGSEIRFKDRGSHVLKGIPGNWDLFAVESLISKPHLEANHG
jgi:class 3 adenylate cyclase